jgi:hypothetical protein
MLTPIRKNKRDFFIRKLRQWFKKNELQKAKSPQ